MLTSCWSECKCNEAKHNALKSIKVFFVFFAKKREIAAIYIIYFSHDIILFQIILSIFKKISNSSADFSAYSTPFSKWNQRPARSIS